MGRSTLNNSDEMTSTYRQPEYAYTRSPDQSAPRPAHHGVVIVGAGPVGLATALDLASRGVDVVLLDEDGTVSVGSRAVCYAKRTLEILDRLGCGEAVTARGVGWQRGKVFFRDALLYAFDLLPEEGHRRPAFVNLQQYHLEELLVAAATRSGRIDLRWHHRVVDLATEGTTVTLRVETPDGPYALACDWLIACDGARSPVRHLMGLESQGEVFRDRFLIADVVMKADFPAERWFWFDPPFHRNQSALLHRQADNVWRIDFQLGWDADPEEEKKPERVIPRVRSMLGATRPAGEGKGASAPEFELEWVSVYTFQCRRMARFRHGRVLFAGDAAHQVSPFGARGANSGVQDADNLAWKLALVLQGQAPERLLDTYSDERVQAADENLLNSTRSTDFITPKSNMSRTFRDAALELAARHPFARRLVNSGRLSVPATLARSPLNTPDADPFRGAMVPGASAADAPVMVDGAPAWFLDRIGGAFTLVHFGAGSLPAMPPCGGIDVDVVQVGRDVLDAAGLLGERYDAIEGTTYLFRPDQHVCARWRRYDPQRVREAVMRATCNRP
jgi:3-(3-hydroxy-phenyl)propionate hydroxylase